MNRGHIRHTKACSAKTQENILLKAGVNSRVIYTDDLETAIADLRKGDGLMVVGLLGLAGRRQDIAAILDRIHAKGAAAIDAATGRRSDGPHGAALMLEAVDELTAHRRGPGNKAAQAGSKGGIQAAKNGRKDKPPFTVIKPIWFDRRLDDAQVMQAIADLGYPKEISYTTIWREFGRRYGSDGRRAAKKQ